MEARYRASDLPTRRADSTLPDLASQFCTPALLEWSCTLEWARDGTNTCGYLASKRVASRMNQSAAALMTASCRSKWRRALSGNTPAVARFIPNGPGEGWSWMQRGR